MKNRTLPLPREDLVDLGWVVCKLVITNMGLVLPRATPWVRVRVRFQSPPRHAWLIESSISIDKNVFSAYVLWSFRLVYIKTGGQKILIEKLKKKKTEIKSKFTLILDYPIVL